MRVISALALACALVVPLTIAPTAQAAPPTCAGLKATIVGDAKDNTIRGTAKRDVIVAGAGDDVIRGFRGNDVICGGEGADTIAGGGGNDLLYGEADRLAADVYGRIVKTGDHIIGGAGDDTIDLGHDPRPASEGTSVRLDSVSYAQAPNPVVVDLRLNPVQLGADGTDTLVTGVGVRFVGSDFGDMIKGSNHADSILGRGGDDTIFGNGGDDVIFADVAGALGNDRLYGDDGDDSLSGTLGTDVFTGGRGSDTMRSTSQSHQVFRGGGGADTVTFPLPLSPGFQASGHGGQDRLRLLANPNPALTPKVRIDQKRGKTAIRGLAAYTLEGRINGFSEVSLPARAQTSYFGTNASEMVTADPAHPIRAYMRGGADIVIGSNGRDRIDGGKGDDIARAKGGKDKCKHVERRTSC